MAIRTSEEMFGEGTGDLPLESDKVSDSPAEETPAENPEVEVEAKGEEEPPPESEAETPEGEETPPEAEAEPEEPESPEKLLNTVRATREERDTEKKRRKEAEAEARESAIKIAALEARVNTIQEMGGVPKKDPESGPDDYEQQFWNDPVKFMRERDALRDKQIKDADFNTRARVSEHLVSKQHDDYEEAKEAFMEAAGKPENAWMAQQVVQAEFPAEILYAEGKKLLGGGESDTEEVAQLKAQIEELKAAQTNGKPAPPTIPKSNAGSRGSGASPKKEWTGPRAFENVFPE